MVSPSYRKSHRSANRLLRPSCNSIGVRTIRLYVICLYNEQNAYISKNMGEQYSNMSTSSEKKPMLHAIGNAHIDPVWLWRWPEGLETIRATFRSVLDRMNEYDDFVFTGSSAAFYSWLKDTDQDLFVEIAARIREGRWEIVGGWWIQPDANIPSGESLVRQALYGQRFFQKEFGVMATIGYNPDTFGHAGTLPQILRKSGMTRYVFMRPMKHEKTIPGNVFLWQSPDGTQVTTCRIARSYGTWGEDLSEHVKESDQARPSYVKDYIAFYGVGNHGGGPTKRNIDSIHDFNVKPDRPRISLSTLTAFFESIEQEMKTGVAVPVVADDLQHHARGCYTAESEVKRQNRRLEHLLMTAERFASMAHTVLGKGYPATQLENAWKAVLFNQFHDILAGSSLPEAYQDARDGYGYAAHIANNVTHTSIQALSSRVDTRGTGDALIIFNPLPWAVIAPIEVERGSASISTTEGSLIPAQAVQPTTVVGQRRSCFVAEIPALGYRVFRQDSTVEASDNPLFKPVADALPQESFDQQLMISTTLLENRFWRIVINPESGLISSMYDKGANVEILASPANAGVVIEDLSDTWSHEVISFRNEIGRFGGAKIKIEENGPVRACLSIETHYGDSTLIQRLLIYRDINIIECRMTVNWQEQAKMLKLSFPLKLQNPVPTYDIAYGSIVRKCNGEEEPGQQWVDVTGVTQNAIGESVDYGLSLINDCKYGFDVLDAELRMSVLRSPIYAYHDPYKPEPNRQYVYQDQGIQTVTYRLVPHAGGWEKAAISRSAWELHNPPVWVNEFIHNGELPATASFLSIEPENIILAVSKKAEDSDTLVVRAYESCGRTTYATLKLPMQAAEFSVAFQPHEIKTWQIGLSSRANLIEVDMLERAV